MVADALLLDTRTWQLLKLRNLFAGGSWFAARQLKSDCGLSPWNGWKTFLPEKVATPEASAETGDGDVTLIVVGPSTATVKKGSGRIDVGAAREAAWWVQPMGEIST